MTASALHSPLAGFSAPARAWFSRAFGEPTPAQDLAWQALAAGDSALVVAPTGSGKTLAAFFAALDMLATRSEQPERATRTSVVYISPLKALAVDVERNLRAPLAGLRQESIRAGLAEPDITVAIRTGDTTPDERRRQARNPPDILITTPESLYLLLTSAARETLREVRTVIVDEIHAVADTKRGAHLAVSLERLSALGRGDEQRIGLSATVTPVADVARFLGGRRPVRVVQPPADKQVEIRIEVPVEDMADLGAELPAHTGSAAAEGPRTSIWPHVEQRVLELIAEHRTTLVFVNSRRLAERLTARLNELADDVVARAHHGSVSKEQRALIEEDLKAGRLAAVVATSSLELGIDMGAVDLVVQVESPPSAAAGLQRIGRAGHHVGAVSKGTIFPKFRADLLTATVVTELMRRRELAPLKIPENPLDVLAQQVVAAVAMDDWSSDELAGLMRRAAPFARLPDSAWTAVLDMLAGRYQSDGLSDLRPKLVWDRTSDMLTARPGAQRLAVTSGGTIPDRGLFAVHLVGERSPKLGELDEEMVYESRVGDVFALGASSWRIEDITHDRVLVSPAPGRPGKMPFWHGDSLGRGYDLGRRVGEMTRELAALPGDEAATRLTTAGLGDLAASNLLAYLDEQRRATGRLPDDRTLVLERFRDELGDWQVALLSPFGAAVHAPWAMVIDARLRATTGLDVQVMHADDGIVLRLPDADDDGLWDQVNAAIQIDPDEISDLVTNAIGGSALFASRFRECAARALLLPKRDPSRRAPLWQQRQRSAGLLAAVVDHPTFPIVAETVRECVQDVFDVPALRQLLGQIATGAIRVHDVTSASASPFARSLLFGYVAAFMYEGDSPLAERRAQALTLDATLLADLLGTHELRELLDPQAIADVAADIGWLRDTRRLRHAEDLADALRVLGPLSAEDIMIRGGDPAWGDDLIAERRAFGVTLGTARVAAIEDAGRLRDALGVPLPIGTPLTFTEPMPDPLGDLLARYARTHPPFTTAEAATHFGIGTAVAAEALGRLADRAILVTGEFSPGGSGTEWCDAEVLRRIRRRSVALLRAAAEPVAQPVYASFLQRWHGVRGGEHGVDGVYRAIEQLAGLPLPASAVETLILPARVHDYAPAMMDELTTAGEVIWCGAGATSGGDGWLVLAPSDAPELLPPPTLADGDAARAVIDLLRGTGGWFYGPLADRLNADLGISRDDLAAVLTDLLWAGWLTNDTLGPVRSGLTPTPARRPRVDRTPPRRRAARYPRPARGAAARIPSRLGGRWSLVVRGDVDETWRAAVAGTWLLDRHAVVTRGVAAAERFPGGFSALYRVLRAVEDSGGCIRSYAIEGLGAAQFTTAAVVDQLRDRADAAARAAESGETATPVLLAATDPAQPFGAALRWPERPAAGGDSAGHRPGRKAGAAVVISDDGLLLAYLERGGRTLLTWTDDPSTLASCARVLAEGVREGRLPTLTITRRNGADIVADPAVDAFTEAGFRLTPRGLRLRAV